MTIKAIDVRNQFKDTVKEIIEGSVFPETDMRTVTGIITSVITTRSVKELELVIGGGVITFVKPIEVSIAKLRRRLHRVYDIRKGGDPEEAPSFFIAYRQGRSAVTVGVDRYGTIGRVSSRSRLSAAGVTGTS